MDSSRGGPLSTLILMLPLIVVPALVVMRPSEQDSGFSSDDLAAGVDDVFAPDSDSMGSMFGDNADRSSDDAPQPAGEFDLREMPFDDFDSPEMSSQAPAASELHAESAPLHDSRPAPATGAGSRRTPDLSRWGVTHSIWFAPGNNDQIGFAAFVPHGNGQVRYRFAAIGTSDRQVIEDVVRQIQEWQSPASSTPRTTDN